MFADQTLCSFLSALTLGFSENLFFNRYKHKKNTKLVTVHDRVRKDLENFSFNIYVFFLIYKDSFSSSSSYYRHCYLLLWSIEGNVLPKALL